MQINVRKLESMGSIGEQAESSMDIRRRVVRARQIQKERNPKGRINAYATTKEILSICNLHIDSKALLNTYEDKYGFSARVYYKIIKLSRTIADLSESDTINVEHINEALRYRYGD